MNTDSAEQPELSSDSDSEHAPKEVADTSIVHSETKMIKRCKISCKIVGKVLLVAFVLFFVFSATTFFATFTGTFVVPSKITALDYQNHEQNVTNQTTEFFSPAYSGSSHVRYADFLKYLNEDEFEAGMYRGLTAWRVARWLSSVSFYFGIGFLTLGAPVGMKQLHLAFRKAPLAMGIPLFLIPTLNCVLTSYMYLVLQFKDDESDRLAFYISYLLRLSFIYGVFLACYQYAKITGLSSIRSRLEFTLCLIGPSMIASFLAAIAFPQYIMPAFARAGDFERSMMAVAIPNVAFFLLFVAARLSIGRLESNHYIRVKEAEASCIILSFLSIFWSRILVCGNQPRSSLAGTSFLIKENTTLFLTNTFTVLQVPYLFDSTLVFYL